MKKLSPDESIMGAITLYLDFINLCEYGSIGRYPIWTLMQHTVVLSILRLLNNVEDR